MTTQPTPNRWRPRFSVRTLVVLVTLVCCYAACWGPTERWGVQDVMDHVAGNYVTIALFSDDTLLDLTSDPMAAKMPLVVGFNEPMENRRHYYFWFFGYVAKLPYERNADDGSRVPIGLRKDGKPWSGVE